MSTAPNPTPAPTPASPAGTPPAAAPANAAAAGQAPDQGQQPAAPAAPSGQAYRPEGLPDHLAGATTQETLDKVYKAFNGFQQRASTLAPPPEAADKYEITFSDKAAPFMADVGDDKFFAGLKDDAFAAGLNNEQATKFINSAIERMVEMGVVDAPVDVATELAKLTPASARNASPAEQDAARQARVSTNIAHVNALVAEGFDKDSAAELIAELAAFPALNALFEHQRNGGVKPALNGQQAPAVTQDTIKARLADPRQQFGNSKYEPAFAAETDRMYKALHGSAPRS